MAKKPSGGGSGKPPPPPRNAEWDAQESAARQTAEWERRAFVTEWAGYGLPLAELGLLMVPQLSEAEVLARYAEQIETGQANQKKELVGWLWQSAKEGNASVQMFLAGHVLGWKRSNPDLKGKPPQTVPQKPDTPDPSKRADLPTAEAVARIYTLPARR